MYAAPAGPHPGNNGDLGGTLLNLSTGHLVGEHMRTAALVGTPMCRW
jgi:hypothetical protein